MIQIPPALSRLNDFCSVYVAYEGACRAAGTDFTAIELQPIPQPDGAVAVARSSGAVAGVVGAVVAALAV